MLGEQGSPYSLAEKRKERLHPHGKSLEDIIQDMEDEVLTSAGVDVFEEVFKLIFAKLFDGMQGGSEPQKLI